MGTIIEFPANAASRRPGSAMGGAVGDGMGTVLILPVVRIERQTDETGGGHGDRNKVQQPAAVAVGVPDIGRLKCRRGAFRSGPPEFGHDRLSHCC
jgi:hypothetical protein